MEFKEYQDDALNEYPKLCRELADMTKAICSEIGASFSQNIVSENLEATWNNKREKLGSVKRPDWIIEKDGTKINFKPDGLTLLTFARVKVTSPNKKINLVESSYFIVSSMNGKSKVLAKLNPQNEAIGLDKETLKSDIESFLK